MKNYVDRNCKGASFFQVALDISNPAMPREQMGKNSGSVLGGFDKSAGQVCRCGGHLDPFRFPRKPFKRKILLEQTDGTKMCHSPVLFLRMGPFIKGLRELDGLQIRGVRSFLQLLQHLLFTS